MEESKLEVSIIPGGRIIVRDVPENLQSSVATEAFGPPNRPLAEAEAEESLYDDLHRYAEKQTQADQAIWQTPPP